MRSHQTFNTPSPTGFVRERVSEQEWKLRCELAAAHRLIAHFMFVDIYHHFFELACRARVGALAGGGELVMPSPETCAERVQKFGRIGIYDSGSRDWVASMALAEKLFPDYKE